MKFSLKSVLIFCFTAIISITVIAIIIPSYYSSKNIMSKHAHDIMDNISTFAVDKSKTFMIAARDAAQLTQKLALKDVVNSEDIKSMELYFYEQLQINAQFAAIYLGMKNGDFLMVLRTKDGYMTKIITRSKPTSKSVKRIFYDKDFKYQNELYLNEEYDPRARPWYKLAQQNKKLIWTDPYVFFTAKKPGITTAAPLYDKNNKLKAVIGVDIQISKLSTFISTLKISDNSKVFIIDKSLKVVAFPHIKTIEINKDNSNARLLKINEIKDEVALKAYSGFMNKINKNKIKENKESTFSFENKEIKYFAKFVPFEMNNIKWTIGMYVPESDYLGRLKENQNKNLLWMLLIGIISLITTYVISKTVSEPIDRLKNMAHHLSELNLETKSVEPSVFSEIDETIQSFNKMKETLLKAMRQAGKKQQEIKEKNNQLLETKQLLQDIIDNAPIRIFWKDKKSIYLGANKLFIKDFGLNDVSELVGKSGTDFSKLKHSNYLQDDESIMNNDCSKLNYVETLTNTDGTTQIINTSKVPLHNYMGDVVGIVGVYDDITEQVNTQNELKQKEFLMLHQSKLAAMGEMIGNIAHQWRQPLTIVSSLVMSMQLKLEMDMYDEGFFNKKLSSINDSLQHMSKTIDDFREFFKPQKEKKLFNLRFIYEKISNLIGEDFKSKKVEVITDLQDINIKGFDNELIQVLINIINNAIYAISMREVERKLIFINVVVEQNNVLISILDNGGGIENKILDKVFEPYFTTKHKSQGTGIGLYMSSEIIKKHMDGDIIVENLTYDYEGFSYEGAKFTIVLPLS